MTLILPAITVGLGIVCIGLAVLHILAQRKLKDTEARRLMAMQRLETKRGEIVKVERERDEARKQRDELNRENESLHTANKRIVTEQLELHKQNTKLREDLTEAMSCIGNLQIEIAELQKRADHATIPIAEVAPAKRTTRKKAVN